MCIYKFKCLAQGQQLPPNRQHKYISVPSEAHFPVEIFRCLSTWFSTFYIYCTRSQLIAEGNWLWPHLLSLNMENRMERQFQTAEEDLPAEVLCQAVQCHLLNRLLWKMCWECITYTFRCLHKRTSHLPCFAVCIHYLYIHIPCFEINVTSANWQILCFHVF